MITKNSREQHVHFHVRVIENGEVVYDYTDLWATHGVNQFGAIMAPAIDEDYDESRRAVAEHFLEVHNAGELPYLIIPGEYMTSGFFRCNKRCFISPSMN